MRAPRLEKHGSGGREEKHEERGGEETQKRGKAWRWSFHDWGYILGNKVAEDERRRREGKKNNRAWISLVCHVEAYSVVDTEWGPPSACQCVKVRNKDKFVPVRSPPDVPSVTTSMPPPLLLSLSHTRACFYLSIKMSTGCCVRWATSRPI